MTLNEALTKQKLLAQILLKSGDSELSKALKIKVMRARVAYSDINKKFETESQEFIKELIPERLRELSQKENRTDEEAAELDALNLKVNSEYNEYLIQKGNEEVTAPTYEFTEEDYEEIVDVNSDAEVEINGNKMKATDFLEAFYVMFIK